VSSGFSLVSGIAILAAGLPFAAYYLLAVLPGSMPRRAESSRLSNRCSAWSDFLFALFVMFMGIFLIAGSHWPDSAKWSINAFAAVILILDVVLVLRQYHA
jgi:uncharacterized membrane protein